MSVTSWTVWARGLKGLSPTQQLVLLELARLADCRGVVIASVDYLQDSTSRSKRAIFSSLSALEQRGVLTREPRRLNGRQAASRLQLRAQAVAATAEPRASSPKPGARLGVVVEVEPVDMDDNEGLRRLLALAQNEAWEGPAAQAVAQTIMVSGRRQFWTAITRGEVLGGMGREESLVDTLGHAWELARLNAEELIAARRPWALLTTMVTRLCVSRDSDRIGVDTADPADIPEGGLRPGEGNSGEVNVGVDDFEGPVKDLVLALVEAGMEETLAWAGTLRIAELAVGDSSRRHTLAASDPRLADLGVPPQCCREWMTLLAGSRRGTRPSIVEISPCELRERARCVVDALRAVA